MAAFENHYRERAVAYLVARDHATSGTTSELAVYGPADEESTLTKRIDALLAIPEEARVEALTELRAGLLTGEEAVLMSEIHPSWLVDVLAQESPRVVGLLLRYLPSQHSRYVLEHLPRRLKDRLPNIVDAFAVPDQVLRIVRARFESHFHPMRPASDVDHFTFDTLHLLALGDLKTLFHDIGIHELALAFRKMAKPALRVLFNRLQFSDAKALAQRIEAFRSGDAALERDARYTILELSLDESDPMTIIREIGVQALAKALSAAQLPMVELLKQKLPPSLAYLLRRDADIHVPNNHPALVERRQQQILVRIATLSREGEIDAKWWRAMPEAVRKDPLFTADATMVLAETMDDSETGLAVALPATPELEQTVVN